MLVRTQFFICALCISSYFFVCIILFIVKNFILNEITTVKHQQQTKNVGTEISTLQENNFKAKANVLQKSTVLLQQISDICMKYDLKTPTIKRHFLHSAKHKSLYCWIRKVASTSFIKLFSDMNNRRLSHNFYKEVDFLSPKSSEGLQRLVSSDTVFKLLVIRHPFQRLLSSYRDRIEDNSRYTAQAWLYARQIFYLSRPHLFRFGSNGNALQRIFLPNKKLRVVPSFREFLEWLLNQPPDRDDVHWAQYYTHCALCNVSYSFVLKLDDYSVEEVDYVLSKLRLNTYEIYLPQLHRTRNGVTDFNITCKYFGSLSTDTVLRLYERYKVDLEMFNYRINEYLHCAKQQ